MSERNFLPDNKSELGPVDHNFYSIKDADGVERYVQGVETRWDSEGNRVLHSLRLQSDHATVDVLKEIDIDPTSTRILVAPPGEKPHYKPVAGEVCSSDLDTPLGLLVLLHECAHRKQYEGAGLTSIRAGTVVDDILLSWSVLSNAGLDLDLPQDVYDRLKLMRLSFEEILVERNEASDPTLRTDEFKTLLKEFTNYVKSVPALAALSKKEEMIIEHDAHAKTNQKLELFSKAMGVDFDFINNREDKFLNQANDTSMYSVAYRVLSHRKIVGGLNPDLTLYGLCEQEGIPLKKGSIPQELAEKLDDPEFQAALEEVRKEIVSKS